MTTTKSAAITTGANQGIGRATAVRLARDFLAIVLVARDDGHFSTNGRKRVQGI